MDTAVIQPLLDLCEEIVTLPVPERRQSERLVQLLMTNRPDMAHRLFTQAFEIDLSQLLERNQFDVVQIEGIELARYLPVIRIMSETSRVVFDNHNAETALQRRAFMTDWQQPRRWLAAIYSWIQMNRLRRLETWACQHADWVTAVSETDRHQLQKMIPDLRTPITVIPNCIDVRHYHLEPDDTIQYDLVFSGKMDYRPNIDAVLWFAQAVWPLIRQERPSTSWAIVGQKPQPRIVALQQQPNITVTGWVEQVQPYLAGAQVCIMPFRIGSGTRLKLIESMAAAKAIVSTPIGAEGFPIQNGEQLLLAETPEAMATAVLDLLNNPTEQKRLGGNARQFAQQYDWRQVIPQFETIYTRLFK